MHSIGAPLADGAEDVPWPTNAETKYIVHYPRDARDLVLRVGLRRQRAARQEVLRAAHRLDHGARRGLDGRAHAHPQAHLARGRTSSTSRARSRARAARRTWRCSSRRSRAGRVETVGDDIAWMKFGEDGRLYAINPEAGFFGVAPGTGEETNPNAMAAIKSRHALHQLRAHRRRRRVVGGHDEGQARAPDRLARQGLDAGVRDARRASERALHGRRGAGAVDRRRSGRTPVGVPIDAFLFGGRRASVVPLVREAFDWEHGVFLGATMSSEMTAAAFGTVGQLRFDPFAQLPFAGYNMGDYMAHWLEIGRKRRRAAAADLLRQLVPQGRRRQVPVARLRRELARARVDRPSSATARSTRSRRRSASCPRAEDLNTDGLDIAAGALDELLTVADRPGSRRAARRSRSSWRSSATGSRPR